MQEFIIITPERLKTVISETVKDEFAKHIEALSITEPTIANTSGEYVTRKEAAKILGVSLPTLNEWTKSGIIIGYRIATRVRYKRNELEQALKQMQTSKNKKAA